MSHLQHYPKDEHIQLWLNQLSIEDKLRYYLNSGRCALLQAENGITDEERMKNKCSYCGQPIDFPYLQHEECIRLQIQVEKDAIKQ